MHHLLHVRLPLRHPRPSQGRPHPLHRGQPRPPGQPGRALRQGLGRHHAARTRRRGCSAPLLRVGERGSGEFEEIELGRGARDRDRSGCRAIRATDPKKLAFFTGRDQSQALTGWWAPQFGTPNFAAHGGFCSVNMAAAGHLHLRRLVLGVRRAGLGAHPLLHAVRRRRGPRLQPDQDRPRQAARRSGAKFVSVNPVRTGYSAIADEWLGIRPGTDGLFVAGAGPRAAARPTGSISTISSATPTRLAGDRRAGRRR